MAGKCKRYREAKDLPRDTMSSRSQITESVLNIYRYIVECRAHIENQLNEKEENNIIQHNMSEQTM